MSKSNELKGLLDKTIETYGKLDILVNNAGIYGNASVRDQHFMQTFDKIMAVDLRPYVELSHLSVPYLDKTNGTIISISSVASMLPVSHINSRIVLYYSFKYNIQNHY